MTTPKAESIEAREVILNLADWTERRKDAVGPYAEYIIFGMREYEAEIQASREKAEAAEARSYALAVAIMGGEDAPGYANSVPTEALVDQQRKMAAEWTTAQASIGADHPDDIAVNNFAAAMKVKMARGRSKGRAGWRDPEDCSTAFLADMLVNHLPKGNAGNFEDIANLAMMLHQRGDDPACLAAALQRAKDAEWDAAVEACWDAYERVGRGFSGHPSDEFRALLRKEG